MFLYNYDEPIRKRGDSQQPRVAEATTAGMNLVAEARRRNPRVTVQEAVRKAVASEPFQKIARAIRGEDHTLVRKVEKANEDGDAIAKAIDTYEKRGMTRAEAARAVSY